MRRPLIEAYVETAEQASAAVAAGADRIELCGPGEGGLTPDVATLDLVRTGSSVPIHAMIRPRSGNFIYDAHELEQMRAAIAHARGAGVAGVVFGVLRGDATLDADRMAELTDLARPMRVVCHRAFDATPRADAALDALLSVGVDGVLTSGHAPTAAEGAALIARHVVRAGTRLEVIAGGTVRAENVRALVEATGVHAVHACATGPAVLPALVTALGRR